MRIQSVLLMLCVFTLLAGGCAEPGQPLTNSPTRSELQTSATRPPPAGAENHARPTQGWPTSTPEEQGLDGAQLVAMIESVRARDLNFHSILVIRNGVIVSETYFGSYDATQRHEIYSVTKSFTATLVGIALEQGMIQSIDQKVLDFFPNVSFQNLDERKQTMTLENVLTMASGLEWQDTDANFGALYRSDDWAASMLDRTMEAAPGERWNYCSGCSHLLTTVLQRQAGMSVLEFAEKNLFEPLGIKNYNWDTDSQGIPIGGWSLQMAPMDMAKLGYLYLHAGQWEGNQVVPAEWIREVIRPRFDTDSLEGLRYGYHWWIYPRYGAYAALGRAGQTVFVVPDQDLIVVTTAEMSGHAEVFRLIEEYILPSSD